MVVPTRGGISRLPRLVEAFASQSQQEFEVIFVVDGDLDGSSDYLSSSLVKDKLTHSRVITFSENRGRSVALNEGFSASNGEILIRCDDDLEPNPGYIQNHIDRHERLVQGVVGLTRNVLPDTPYARAYGNEADRLAEKAALDISSGLRWRHWAGNVSIPRSIWSKVGMYDISYRRYGWEDVDYGYRIHRAGYPIVIAPELTTPHHAAAVTTKIRSLRALHSGAARDKFVELHGEDVLPQAYGTTLWNRLVSGVAEVSNENSISIASNLIDHVLPVVPSAVGRKLVALMVESSGLAGVRYPSRAKQSF
ncbi:glycosyltransferase family 2 protein [Neomicrococcus lactis]|uniref:glycosyltransferase family 2 protein n=1 Tax=Neomicrococcus lactis TaxID=732241 RepID=UPI003B831F1F